MPSHHNKGSAPGGSQRQLRVGETVRHAVADILSEGNVHDPDLEGDILTSGTVMMWPSRSGSCTLPCARISATAWRTVSPTRNCRCVPLGAELLV